MSWICPPKSPLWHCKYLRHHMILRLQEHLIWGQFLSHRQCVWQCRCRACGVGCWSKKQTGSKAGCKSCQMCSEWGACYSRCPARAWHGMGFSGGSTWLQLLVFSAEVEVARPGLRLQHGWTCAGVNTEQLPTSEQAFCLSDSSFQSYNSAFS